MSSVKLQLQDKGNHVVMDNGIARVTLSKPDGIVTGIEYNGIDNLLEVLNEESNRGYWDLVWSGPGTAGTFDVIKGTKFEVIIENEEQIEISFTRKWDPSQEGKAVPLNIDKRFVMLRGSSGFYTYAIYEHLKEWPAFSIAETRIAFKLRKEKFHYMAITDDRQRFMPLPDDRLPDRGQALAYPEAVLLVNPVEPQFKGESGILQVFMSAHYTGEDLVPKFSEGEAWKKVFGPVFVYLNSSTDDDNDPLWLWQDAKSQMNVEVESWPYSFPASDDYVKAEQRGNVVGRLLVQDRYVDKDFIAANRGYVGLALPGAAGSWQRECKDYQFWTRTDEEGFFNINGVRPGQYNLYAWIPGFIGDYKYDDIITITPGCYMYMEDLVYQPPRNGATLWEIGFPDRSAAEFYAPDPNPKYINKLYQNHPDRKKESKTYQGTTWQIKFELKNIDKDHIYTLRVAIASATFAELQVRVNDANASPLFTSGLIGRDNSIARHGIHGLYWLFNVDVAGSKLVEGENTLFLTQPRSVSPFQGIMYDYIRFEAPS
ncbi:hypothetical protein Bca101_069370 [Brassica carinata]